MEELTLELLCYLEIVCTVRWKHSWEIIWKVVVSLTQVCDKLRFVALPWSGFNLLLGLPSKAHSPSMLHPLSWKIKAGCSTSLYCLVKKQMQCFLHISLLSGIATWFGVLVSVHQSSVCRSNWKQMTQVVVITHILWFFSSSVASAPYLSCVDTSWNTISWSVVVHINCQVRHCLSLILVFLWQLSQVLFQDKCTVGTREENIFS